MTLTGERQRRIRSVGYDYDAAGKEPVLECNLCWSPQASPVARRDRYGFRRRAPRVRSLRARFLSPRLTPAEYGRFTDLLLLRLDAEHANAPRNLSELMHAAADQSE